MQPKKEMKISAIQDGTVIDHIPSDTAFKVAAILDLQNTKNIVSIATNLKSKKQGTKGIIKVGGKILTQSEVNKIAVIAPNATVNLISNYEVKEKIEVQIPDNFIKTIKCSNPICITNTEEVETKFYVVRKEPLKVKCHYCERNMQKEDIELI